jgi:uncharacterized protein (DUF433 family)
MASISDRAIKAILLELTLFSNEYPASPAKKAAATLRELHAAYKGLVAGLAKKPKEKKHPTKKRIRKPTPRFGFHTPAHIRIMSNVVEEEDTGCLVWCGTGTPNHGTIMRDDKTTGFVHRVMYEHYHGCQLTGKQVVRHTCDNGFCVNKEHLIIGTQRDNVLDMIKRGRGGRKGTLTTEQAKDILIRYRKGESASVLAKEFGITLSATRQIGKNTFRYLQEDPDIVALGPNEITGQLRQSKLKLEDVKDIKRRLFNGESNQSIWQDYQHVDLSVMSAIRTGRRWGNVKIED